MTNSDTQYVFLTYGQMNFDPENLIKFLGETVALYLVFIYYM